MTAELRRVVDELRTATGLRSAWRMMNSLPAGVRQGDLGDGLPGAYSAFLTVPDGWTE